MNTTNKNLLCLFIFLLAVVGIQSQNKEIDSLKNELSIHTQKDAARVDLLYKLAFSFFQSDMELTKLYIGEAESLSNELNYTEGKAKVLYLKGILESIKSNSKESLVYFKKSLQHYESIDNQKGIAGVYVAFGITHFDQSQYEEALNSYKNALEIYKDLGDEREVITCLINIGNAYSELGSYTEAISSYKEALHKSEVTNDESGVSYVLSNIAVVYKAQGNYQLAIDYYNKGLDYHEKIRDTLGMANKLNNLGDVYTALNKYDKALEYHKKSLKFSSQKENKHLVATNNNNIGNIYVHKKKYEKALSYYRTSLEISKEINYMKQTSICFNNIGKINLLLNRPLIARENFIKAKDISQKIGSKNRLSVNYLGIADTYLQEQQYQKALIYAQKGKKIADKLKLLETQKDASELLSVIYSKTGNYKKAFKSHQQFKMLSDSIFNKENFEKITQLEYEYKYKNELASAEKRELKLTKTVRTTSQNLEKSQSKYLWAIIGFLLVSILSSSVIFYQKYKNIKSKNQNIAIEQKLLRSQMTSHFIFNSLSVLQGMILNKEGKKSVLYLSKFSKLLRIILENSRDKMVSLSQELTAIENYLTLQNLENELYQYTVEVEDTIDASLFKIPPMLIQPFVENAIEHGFENQKGNKYIAIYLKYLDKKLICTITDNGIGVDSKKENKNQYKKSLSTTITSERLKILSKDFHMKGSVTIEDRQKYNEQGTIVTLVIPYKIHIS